MLGVLKENKMITTAELLRLMYIKSSPSISLENGSAGTEAKIIIIKIINTTMYHKNRKD